MNNPSKKSLTARSSSRHKNATSLNTKDGASDEIVKDNVPLEETEQEVPTSANVHTLAQYLSEIRQHPLLTVEQEQALARRMRAGDSDTMPSCV